MKRYYKHIVVITVLLVLVTGLFTNCMLNHIKGTDSILHDDYTYLSLVHGAIAWETGVIRRLYDFGQIFPVYKQDNQGRKIIQGYAHPEKTDQMVRLIHAFFYRVPGSTGETDFGATVQLTSDDPFMVVQTLAKIIALCQNVQVNDQAFRKAVRALATHKNLHGLGLKLINNPLAISGKNRPVWKIFINQAYAKKNQPGYEAHVANVQIVTQFCENLAAIQNLLNKLLKFQALLGAEMGHVILGALRESDPQNSDALYPLHTVEMILLSFVYKKYSYNRNILKAFYDALNEQLGGKIMVHDLDEQWVKDSFAPVTQAQALETIESIFAGQNLMQSIKQHFAEFVYNTLQIRSFPTPVGYEGAVYEYEKGKKTLKFADCMDNTMRNFINLYAYDAEQNRFTLGTLLGTIGLIAVNPALTNFLKAFGDVNMATSQNAHNAWLQVISNIPYVAYNRMIDGSTGQSTKALDTEKGYIAIPENERTNELQNWLQINRYQVMEKNQYGYELQPSVKNIIIVLDHLLQLKLFSQAGGLIKEFMRSDFIKEYFSKLCISLRATGFLSIKKNVNQDEQESNFDILDYTQSEIYTTLKLEEITSNFITYSGHGELKLVETEEIKSEAELIFLLKKIKDFTDQPSLSILVTKVCIRQNIDFSYLKNNLNYLYINLFAVLLEDTGLLKSIIAQMFHQVTNMPLEIKMSIKDLLLRLAENQPDVMQQQMRKDEVLKSFLGIVSSDDIQSGAVDFVRLFKDITDVAAKGISNQNWETALALFRALFEKNQAFEEAIKAATKGVINQDSLISTAAAALFRALFEKNQAFEEAIEIATKGIIDQDRQVRSSALYLFKVLFENNQAFGIAIQVATKGIVDQDPLIRGMAVDLFEALINKDQAFPEAIQAATKGIMDQDRRIRSSALDLFKALVGKDQAFVEAIQAAAKGIMDQNSYVRSLALELFKALVDKGQAFPEATQAAVKGIMEQDSDVRSLAISLFEQLIVKVPDETKKAIQNLLDNSGPDLSDNDKKRLCDLIEQTEGTCIVF